jgi:DNA invertase Pin-like site-specific DNA recombinase
MHRRVVRLFQAILSCNNYVLWYHFIRSYNVAIYARTSPDCTVTAEDQVQHLKAIAADHGWTVASVFIDRLATVKKDSRPGEAALLQAIRDGAVEKVLAYGIDRVGRSLVDLVGFWETCRVAGVGLYLHEQGLDTTVSNGLSLFDLSEMLAFHLRQARRGRILRGLAAVRGIVRFGRPPIPATKVEKAKKALMTGKGVREAARLAGISAASVSRMKQLVVSVPAAAV